MLHRRLNCEYIGGVLSIAQSHRVHNFRLDCNWPIVLEALSLKNNRRCIWGKPRFWYSMVQTHPSYAPKIFFFLISYRKDLTFIWNTLTTISGRISAVWPGSYPCPSEAMLCNLQLKRIVYFIFFPRFLHLPFHACLATYSIILKVIMDNTELRVLW